MFIILVLILGLFTLIQRLLTRNSSLTDPQITSIESGFEALKYSSYMRSSFFMLAVLFVLFDLELILLFPRILNHQRYLIIIRIVNLVILGFIALTLIWEWWFHGLKWSS